MKLKLTGRVAVSFSGSLGDHDEALQDRLLVVPVHHFIAYMSFMCVYQETCFMMFASPL